jgi:hypothetical protein
MISHAEVTAALAARELAGEDEDAITPRLDPVGETDGGDIEVRLVTRGISRPQAKRE